MTASPFVLRSHDDDGVLLLTLNRPEKKNAFHEAQWDALASALDEAREDPQVAVAVLTGAGGNFSSGVDLASFTGERPPPRAETDESKQVRTVLGALISGGTEPDEIALRVIEAIEARGGKVTGSVSKTRPPRVTITPVTRKFTPTGALE